MWYLQQGVSGVEMGVFLLFYTISWNYRIRGVAKHAAEDNIPVLAFSILKGYEQQLGS